MMKTLLAAGLACLAFAAPASAVEVNIYPYAESSANYCPAGLQPVVLGGDISCGRPNTNVSYFTVKQHPVQRRHHHGHAIYSKSPVGHSKSPVGHSKSPYGD